MRNIVHAVKKIDCAREREVTYRNTKYETGKWIANSYYTYCFVCTMESLKYITEQIHVPNQNVNGKNISIYFGFFVSLHLLNFLVPNMSN